MRLCNAGVALVVALSITACGGGGGNAGTPAVGPGSGSGSGGSGSGSGSGSGGGSGSSATATVNIGVALSDSSGAATNTVTVASPATARARVTSGTGTPLPGQLVTFTTAGGAGSFTPSTGKALTDADGYASVVLLPSSSGASGADEVVASVSVTNPDGTTSSKSARTGFQLQATNVSISSVTTGVDNAALSANGQTNVTVTLSGAAGVSVGVSLTSTCVAQNKATITPATATTTTGVASFSYKDNGCGASQLSATPTDDLRASITGSTVTSTKTVSLTAATANSVAFVSATPQTIFLKGSGDETSEVVFEVRDKDGNALPNRSVSLDLTSTAGGLSLVNAGSDGTVSQLSDSNGRVSVRVNSGTVPTPVRVRATLVNTQITSLSNNLTVAVGLPSELNFGLAQGTANIEGFDYIDTSNTYTVIASDRMGNPVRDGTTVNFITPEGGQVNPSVQTKLDGSGIARASANFVSSMPRPADGRITVVAYALGEESFEDLNGNNIYDCGEPYQDLGDVFVSRNFLKDFDKTQDQLVPLTTPAGGTACSDPAQQSLTNARLALNATIPSLTDSSVAGGSVGNRMWGQNYVRRAIETVLSTSAVDPVWYSVDPSSLLFTPTGYDSRVSSTGTSTSALNQGTGTTATQFFRVHGSTMTGAGKQGTFSFLLRDANGVRLNPAAAGTTVAATATSGLSATVVAGSPVANTSSATAVAVSYEFTTATSGTITLKFTSPRGLTTNVILGIAQ
ncbi:MAG TPA: hypothetical protein VFP68_22175 [Burkholderiaceae bacterium]|nr:hypothetical protein [Burkholderiaceae bacterium]